jgi:FkbM family methyltransferase
MIGAFVERCRTAASATYLGDGRILCSALGRFRVVVDANDMGLTPNLACDGYWEPGVSVAMANALAPGMTAVDIGANVGYFSLLMVDRVGAAGKVIAVEANPALAELLRETIMLNRLQNLTLHNLAASNGEGHVEFYIAPGRNLNSCILLDEWRDRVDPAQVRRVQAVTADSLLASLDRVDLIKIDVEGAENMVLAGLERTIHRNPGLTIIVEYNFMRHSQSGSLVPMIEQHGFPFREIAEDGSINAVDRASLLDPSNFKDRMLFLRRDTRARA